MGQVTILENRGEGLYRARLAYDLTALNGELLRMESQQQEHFALMLRALNTLELARQATGEAREAMNAVIAQWQQALVDAINENPPILEPPEPNDPLTGEPWEDPDRAQDAPLFAAINAARVAAGVAEVARDGDLDTAIVKYLKTVAQSGRVTHSVGGNVQDRLWTYGYGYDPDVGVGELLAPGALTPAGAVETWKRLSVNRAHLHNADYTEVGVAYLYAPESPSSHWWGAVFAAPGDGPTTETPLTDPAQEEAETTDATLQKIEVPTIDTFQPEKLSAACGAFARARAADKAAEAAVQRLKTEYIERGNRIEKLTTLKTASEASMDVWACQYFDDIPVGDTVKSAEIPGDYRPESTSALTVMGQRDDPSGTIPDTYLSTVERAINIVPVGTTGKLRHGETMSDAAVFVNLALEPGHLKWKPIWRYGTLTSVAGNFCSLILDEINARGGDELSELPIDVDLNLTNVPISYPPCHGEVFEVGDAVLVLFEGQQRDHPKVIGFRREPRPCPGGRISWEQVQ